jgi:hypothetical protein
MASIRKYTQYDDMRGKLGKLIISRNRYGSIAYEQPEYINKPTSGQIRTRLLHKEVIKLWQTLSPKEINFIDMQASEQAIKSLCSPAKIATGYSLFYYLKRNQQEIGEPLTNTVPTLINISTPIINFSIELRDYRIKKGLRLFMGKAIDDNTKVIVYATHSVAGGIGKPKDSWFRIIKVLDAKFKSGSSITKDYINIFKAIDTTAMSIFFRFKVVDKNSGLASNPLISTFLLSIKKDS